LRAGEGAGEDAHVQPYEPRPIDFLGLRRHADWTLKEYSIAYGAGALRRADFAPPGGRRATANRCACGTCR